jgi:hypothetical protein
MARIALNAEARRNARAQGEQDWPFGVESARRCSVVDFEAAHAIRVVKDRVAAAGGQPAGIVT